MFNICDLQKKGNQNIEENLCIIDKVIDIV